MPVKFVEVYREYTSKALHTQLLFNILIIWKPNSSSKNPGFLQSTSKAKNFACYRRSFLAKSKLPFPSSPSVYPKGCGCVCKYHTFSDRASQYYTPNQSGLFSKSHDHFHTSLLCPDHILHFFNLTSHYACSKIQLILASYCKPPLVPPVISNQFLLCVLI